MSNNRVNRRHLLKGLAIGAGTAGVAAPAIAQGVREWRMVTSWPKGLPGLGTGAERVAQRIQELSGGRIRITVYAGGELVPALGCFDAVASGTAQISHDAAYYHGGKTQAAYFFCTVPFGMLANEMNGWIYWGGGQALWDEAYARFGIKPFLAGNTGTQMGGWFRKEINSLADLQGLKIRMPGLGGEVLTRLGAVTVTLPGSEIFSALQQGTVDAAEWIGPYNDLALGFYQVAKNYYFPGFHEPNAALQVMVNKAEWDSLPDDLKKVIEVVCQAENDIIYAEYAARSPAALLNLVETHGVQLKQIPRDVMIEIGKQSGLVLQKILDDGDESAKKVARAFLDWRRNAQRFTRISEQAMANARALPYQYP